MKSAIVTGANGFVGTYLVKELFNQEINVFAIVKDEKENIEEIEKYCKKIIYCELSNISKLDELVEERQFDFFFHLAWAGSAGEARKDYRLQLNNAIACADAADICSKLKCKRFIGAGSVTQLMYGDYFRLDGSEPEMVTCYSTGKSASECIAKAICTANNVEYVWPYISNFYGVGDKSGNIINYITRNYLKGKGPELTSGEQFADFMYVSDVARALVVLAQKGRPGCSYYVGYAKPEPLKKYVLTIRDIINPSLDSGLGRKEFKGLSIDFEKIDYRKVERDTGFVPSVSFEEGIKKTIEWLKSVSE